MPHELIYTSAPKGLNLGSRGFCTVVRTAGIPKALADRLELLSGYKHVYLPGHADATKNPINFSHVIVEVSGQKWHVLSRVADAGLDHTQRSNHLAHHIALTEGEAKSIPTGPAWLLAQPHFMETSFRGAPRVLKQARDIPPQGDLPSCVCLTWKDATGDAGWGGYLAQTAVESHSTVYLIFRRGMNLLPLILEAQALLSPLERWTATFSTYATRLPPRVDCRWRCILEGTPEALTAKKSEGAVMIDLCSRLQKAKEGPLVEAARTGRLARPIVLSAPRPTVRTADQRSPASDLPDIDGQELVLESMPPSRGSRKREYPSRPTLSQPGVRTYQTEPMYRLKLAAAALFVVIVLGGLIVGAFYSVPLLARLLPNGTLDDNASNDQKTVDSKEPATHSASGESDAESTEDEQIRGNYSTRDLEQVDGPVQPDAAHLASLEGAPPEPDAEATQLDETSIDPQLKVPEVQNARASEQGNSASDVQAVTADDKDEDRPKHSPGGEATTEEIGDKVTPNDEPPIFSLGVPSSYDEKWNEVRLSLEPFLRRHEIDISRAEAGIQLFPDPNNWGYNGKLEIKEKSWSPREWIVSPKGLGDSEPSLTVGLSKDSVVYARLEPGAKEHGPPLHNIAKSIFLLTIRAEDHAQRVPILIGQVVDTNEARYLKEGVIDSNYIPSAISDLRVECRLSRPGVPSKTVEFNGSDREAEVWSSDDEPTYRSAGTLEILPATSKIEFSLRVKIPNKEEMRLPQDCQELQNRCNRLELNIAKLEQERADLPSTSDGKPTQAQLDKQQRINEQFELLKPWQDLLVAFEATRMHVRIYRMLDTPLGPMKVPIHREGFAPEQVDKRHNDIAVFDNQGE